MKTSDFRDLEKKVSVLKRRCPWVASMLLHCLRTRDPKAFHAMKLLIARLYLNAA